MKILPLADRLDLVATIGQWHWDEWGHGDPDGSLESWTAAMAEKAERGRIPTTFIAVSEDEELLGSVTIVDCDMDTRPDLWPWLAGLFVTPEARQQGIGSALVNHAMAFIKSLSISDLYLYTSTAESLYRRLGWQVIDRDVYEGGEVTVMHIALIA